MKTQLMVEILSSRSEDLLKERINQFFQTIDPTAIKQYIPLLEICPCGSAESIETETFYTAHILYYSWGILPVDEVSEVVEILEGDDDMS